MINEFIELTDYATGIKLLVNVSSIDTIVGADGKTIIILSRSEAIEGIIQNGRYCVREEYDFIKDKLIPMVH